MRGARRAQSTSLAAQNEMLGGMRAVKYYAWESSLQKVCNDVREKELGAGEPTRRACAGCADSRRRCRCASATHAAVARHHDVSL